jgi:hypothetical protein
MDKGYIFLFAVLAVSGVLGFIFKSLWAGTIPAIAAAIFTAFRVVGAQGADAGWIVGLPLMAAGPCLVFGLVGAAIGKGIKERNKRLLRIVVGTLVFVIVYFVLWYFFLST